MKLEKMKRNRAGRYIPREFADEIVGTLEDYDLEPEFIEGAACVLSYLTCPEGSDMHGAEFPKYLDNGLLALEAEPPAEVMSAAPRGHRTPQGQRRGGSGCLHRAG